MLQKTLKSSMTFRGVGVHCGAPCSMTLQPAQAGTGIVFYSAKNSNDKIVIGKVVPEAAMHATVVKSSTGWMVSTLEHLMAALNVLRVDNVQIQLDGNEVPILDGSAFPFVQAILDVGLVEQSMERKCLTPVQALSLSDERGRSIQIVPHEAADQAGEMVVDYVAEFDQPLLGNTHFSAQITQDEFVQQIAPARTFGFLHQLPMLRHHGLAQGTCLGNTVVMGNDDLLNKMRFADECVRHKVLDLIGDLALLGASLSGVVKACKTGHNFNRLVINHFVTYPDQWRTI